MVCFGWLLFSAVASALDLSSLSGPLPYLGSQVEVNQPLSTPPYLQPQWSATVLFEGKSLGTQWKDGMGVFHYDRLGERYRLNYSATSQLFRPNTKLLLDQLVANVPSTDNRTWGGFGVNGTCDTMGLKYADFFAWMALARPIGEKVIHDTPCSVHRAEYAGPVLGDNDTIIMTACVVSNGTVLEVQTLDIYRIFGKGEPLELQNRDTGDVLGDVSFVCTQGSGASYESKFITHWQVDVSTAFAQYALCNYNGTSNNCMGAGSMLHQVGRRASQAQSLGPWNGQCYDNVDVGNQYSFPAAGLCPPGETPGGRCSWANPRPLRTVRASCVMTQRKLLEVCKMEFGHAPFLRSAKIFEDALASADESKGGCPDVTLEVQLV